MTLAELLEQCRSDQAVYLRHAKTMTCRSMQAAKSGYVGRAAYAGAMVSRREAMIAEGASEPKARSRKTVAKTVRQGQVAEAEATAAGEGTTVPDLQEGQEADAGP